MKSWSSIGNLYESMNLYTPPFYNQPLPFIRYNPYVSQAEVSQDQPYVMLPNYTLAFQSFNYEVPAGTTFVCSGTSSSQVYGLFGDTGGLNSSYYNPYSIEGAFNAGYLPISSVFHADQCVSKSHLPDPTQPLIDFIPGLVPSQYTGEIQFVSYAGQCLETTGDTTSNVLMFSETSQEGSATCSSSYYNFFQTYFLPDHDSTLSFSLTPPYLAPYASFWTCLEVNGEGQLVLQKICSSSSPGQRFQVKIVSNDTTVDYYDAAYTTDYGSGVPISYYFALELVDDDASAVPLCMTAKASPVMFVPCDGTDTMQWFTLTRSLTMRTYFNTTSSGDEIIQYYNDTSLLGTLSSAFDDAIQTDSQGSGFQLGGGPLHYDDVYGYDSSGTLTNGTLVISFTSGSHAYPVTSVIPLEVMKTIFLANMQVGLGDGSTTQYLATLTGYSVYSLWSNPRASGSWMNVEISWTPWTPLPPPPSPPPPKDGRCEASRHNRRSIATGAVTVTKEFVGVALAVGFDKAFRKGAKDGSQVKAVCAVGAMCSGVIGIDSAVCPGRRPPSRRF